MRPDIPDDLYRLRDEGLGPLTHESLMIVLENVIDGDRIANDPAVKNKTAIKGFAVSAAAYASKVFKLIETWRKVMQGETVTRQELDKVFKFALTEEGQNPFSQIYQTWLVSMLISGRINWDTAYVFQQEDETDHFHACLTRMYDILPMIVYLLYSSVDRGNVVDTQRIALERATEFNIVMRASVAAYVSACGVDDG